MEKKIGHYFRSPRRKLTPFQNQGSIKWKDSYHGNFFYAIRNLGCFKNDNSYTMNFNGIDKTSCNIFE